MDRGLPQTIGLAVLTALLTVFVARVDGAPVVREAAGQIAADSVGPRDSSVTIRWLNDANVLALVGTMNGRQIAASQIEAASAHSDTVRALATSLAKEYGDLQRSADSLGGMLHIAPAASALNAQVNAEFQAQIDSMMGKSGGALDRAYLSEQLASHKLMAGYLDQLDGVAEAPELRTWIESANGRVASQVTRIQGQQQALVVADSVVADSLAKRAAARRKRETAMSVSQKPSEPTHPERDEASNVVLVDGSNVAHSTEGGPPMVANLIAIRDKLVEEGLEPIIVADAALRHQIDDPRRYEQMIDDGFVRQAPAGTDADYFILSFARELNASVVSNDRFRDRMKAFPDVLERVIRYMILQAEVVLERRTQRRHGE
jgi:hypothetical protein